MRFGSVGSVLIVALLLYVCSDADSKYDTEFKSNSQLSNEFNTEKTVLEALFALVDNNKRARDAMSNQRRNVDIPQTLFTIPPAKRFRHRRWSFDTKRQPPDALIDHRENTLRTELDQLKQTDSYNTELRQNTSNYPARNGVPLSHPTRLLDETTLDRVKLEVDAKASNAAKKTHGQTVTAKRQQRLQGIGVRGRLLCGQQPLTNTKVKLVDVDPRPDRDDLIAETRTDDNGLFHLSGGTREDTDIEVIMKIYHDCLDVNQDCQRKATWRVPPRYHNNGTLSEWFDIGTVNMELGFIGEERDCRH